MIFSKLFRTDIYWKIQENLRRKSMEMDERIQENDRAFEQVLREGATSDVLHDPEVIKAYLGE